MTILQVKKYRGYTVLVNPDSLPKTIKLKYPKSKLSKIGIRLRSMWNEFHYNEKGYGDWRRKQRPFITNLIKENFGVDFTKEIWQEFNEYHKKHESLWGSQRKWINKKIKQLL